MDVTQDLYAILGVSPEGDSNDIKAAYRAAARRFHPDSNPNEGAALQFREIAAAYETLGDDRARRNYDSARQRLVAEPVYFMVQTTPSKRILPILGEPQVVYVLVDIFPNKDLAPKDRRSTPLNVVLVLDRSTSMRGPRLDRVKVAAHQIVDQLEPGDYLGLVSFSDRADVLIKSEKVTDRAAMKAAINTMVASGGTEILQGLTAGLGEVRRNFKKNYVNHIILLTDGQTYDSEVNSLALADEAAKEGIGISAMGIGDEWNDVFLDEIASRTGGNSAYINSPGAVVRFLNDRIRSLGSAYGERLELTIAPDPDVTLESAFKLIPSPQPIASNKQPLHLGSLEYNKSISLLLQLQLAHEQKEGFRSMLRLDITGDILPHQRMRYKVLSDLSIEVSQNPRMEDPPRPILDALGKLTLYRMQQKAEAALRDGRIAEATQRLETLSTRLLEAGHTELAETAKNEANRVRATSMLSEEGRKTMKFGTRLLLLDAGKDMSG